MSLSGKQAEEVAQNYLLRHGFIIVARNWQTPKCEIDIVASKDACMYFVEVKYRQHAWQGTGFDYVTPRKLKQMTFAAQVWIGQHNWRGDVALGAIEVGGDSFKVTGFEHGFL